MSQNSQDHYEMKSESLKLINTTQHRHIKIHNLAGSALLQAWLTFLQQTHYPPLFQAGRVRSKTFSKK